MNTKKIIYLFIGAMFSVLTGVMIHGPAQSGAVAEMQVERASPPIVEVPENPKLILIPKTKIYYIPTLEARIVYYNGTWYRQYERHWYTSNSYNGPWVYVKKAPKNIVALPDALPKGKLIRFRELK